MRPGAVPHPRRLNVYVVGDVVVNKVKAAIPGEVGDVRRRSCAEVVHGDYVMPSVKEIVA